MIRCLEVENQKVQSPTVRTWRGFYLFICTESVIRHPEIPTTHLSHQAYILHYRKVPFVKLSLRARANNADHASHAKKTPRFEMAGRSDK